MRDKNPPARYIQRAESIEYFASVSKVRPIVLLIIGIVLVPSVILSFSNLLIFNFVFGLIVIVLLALIAALEVTRYSLITTKIKKYASEWRRAYDLKTFNITYSPRIKSEIVTVEVIFYIIPNSYNQAIIDRLKADLAAALTEQFAYPDATARYDIVSAIAEVTTEDLAIEMDIPILYAKVKDIISHTPSTPLILAPDRPVVSVRRRGFLGTDK